MSLSCDFGHRVVSNKFFKVSTTVEGGSDQKVEWAYAFDVHLNSFFPLMVLLHGVQLVLWYCKYESLADCVGL